MGLFFIPKTNEVKPSECNLLTCNSICTVSYMDSKSYVRHWHMNVS